MTTSATMRDNSLPTLAFYQEKIHTLQQEAEALAPKDASAALKLSQEARQLSETGTFAQAPYQTGVARSRAIAADCHYLLGNYDLSLTEGLAALSLYQDLNLPKAEAEVLVSMARCYHLLGDYDLSMETLLKSLELAERLNDIEGQIAVLNFMGVLYGQLENYAQAIDYYEKCLALLANYKNDKWIATIFNNCCRIYTALGSYDEALDYGHQALIIYEKMGNIHGQVRAHNNLGDAYLQMSNDVEKARYHFQQNLSLVADSEWKQAQIIAMFSMGSLLLREKHLVEAIEYLQDALKLALEINAKRDVYNAHQALSKAFEAQGNYQQALYHYQEFHRVNQDLFNENSDQRFKSLEILHRNKAIQQEAEFYRLRNAELERLREQDLLYFEHLSQIKNNILSTASHDLKNPLSALRNFLYLLDANSKTQDEKGRYYVKQMENQIDRMRNLIGNLLDLARLETGRSLMVETCSLTEFAHDALQGFEFSARQKNITLDFYTKPKHLEASFDPSQLRQALDNLLSNAIKYTPTGGKVILTICQDEKDIIIKVIDNGIGIPPEDIPHIFSHFYRVQHPDYHAIEGTGLGLSIVKTIVEQHGGQVEVQSIVGQGSTFSFTLPLHLPESAALPSLSH